MPSLRALTGAPTITTWHVTAPAAAAAASALAVGTTVGPERALWGRTLPLGLLLAGVVVAITAIRARRRAPGADTPIATAAPSPRSLPHAVK